MRHPIITLIRELADLNKQRSQALGQIHSLKALLESPDRDVSGMSQARAEEIMKTERLRMQIFGQMIDETKEAIDVLLEKGGKT